MQSGANSGQILNQMIQLLEQQGAEKIHAIQSATADEFTVQKNTYVDEEKRKIAENYKNELANHEVRMKIEHSKMQNATRIERMRLVNEKVESLRKETREKMRQKLNSDRPAYKELLKNLLIQGLIKLMEQTIHIRCRQSDLDMIKEI